MSNASKQIFIQTTFQDNEDHPNISLISKSYLYISFLKNTTMSWFAFLSILLCKILNKFKNRLFQIRILRSYSMEDFEPHFPATDNVL